MDQHTTVKELKQLVEEFVSERDWEQFHSPKNLSMAIAIEASELMNLFKWRTQDESREVLAGGELLGEATEEVADVVIFCLAFANRAELDLAHAIRSKIKKNCQKYPVEDFKGRF